MIDDQPVLDKNLWELIKWLSKYYNCPIGVSAKAVLPNNLSTKYELKTQLYVKAINQDKSVLNHAKTQKSVYTYLQSIQSLIPVNSLKDHCSNPNGICKQLHSKGFVELVNQPVLPNLSGISFDPIHKDIRFTKDQSLALKNIFSAINRFEKRYLFILNILLHKIYLKSP